MTPTSSAPKLTRRTMLKATVAAGGGLVLSLSIPRLNATLAAESDADFAPNALRDAAAALRACHAQDITQHPKEWGVALGIDRPIDAVDLNCGHSCLQVFRVGYARDSSDVWAHCLRGDLFISGARPGLISAGLRGAKGLGVGRVTVTPFSLPIRGTQSGCGCDPRAMSRR